MHARGGYPLTIVVGLLFGAGAVAAILWLRASAPTRSERLTGALGVAFIWSAFTETHAGRALQSLIFTIPTGVLYRCNGMFRFNTYRCTPRNVSH